MSRFVPLASPKIKCFQKHDKQELVSPTHGLSVQFRALKYLRRVVGITLYNIYTIVLGRLKMELV